MTNQVNAPDGVQGDLETPELHPRSKSFKSLSAVCNKRKGE